MPVRPFNPLVVDRGRSKRHERGPNRKKEEPLAVELSQPRTVAVDDLRSLEVVAVEWFRGWILCEVHACELDGPQVSLRSRDPAHLFGWVDAAELLARVSRGVGSGVKLYDADSAYERLSGWARRVLDGRRSAASGHRVGRFVLRRDGSGGVD